MIPPRRSLALYAILAICSVFASYVFVVLLALVCACLPIYIMVYAESGNLQLGLLALGGIFIAGVLLWSMVPRKDVFAPPGPRLERASHPRFFAELDQIASSLMETVPHEVYLMGSPNAFVADRGGVLGFGSRRVLAIGLPLLSTFSVSEVRAVLAHEFGHYYGGDTRLLPWVYKTQSSMMRALQNVGEAHDGWRIGMLQMLFSLVFGILKWSFGLFLRVSNFVSRKQEFRADELACIIAGVSPTQGCLKKVREAAAAWPSYWSAEVVPVLDQGWMPGIGEGFCRYLAAPSISSQVEKILEKEIAEGKTGLYDSHPPLRERLSAIASLEIAPRLIDDQSATTLFDDPRELENQFIKFINPKLPNEGLPALAWDRMEETVWIPSWKSSVSRYSSLLHGVTPESLPDLMPKLPQLGAEIRDPVGQILTGGQRAQRMLELLGIAMQLAMIQKGWELVNRPGEFYLQRGEERVVPMNELAEMANGKTSREAWAARCQELGITQVSFSSVAG